MCQMMGLMGTVPIAHKFLEQRVCVFAGGVCAESIVFSRTRVGLLNKCVRLSVHRNYNLDWTGRRVRLNMWTRL